MKTFTVLVEAYEDGERFLDYQEAENIKDVKDLYERKSGNKVVKVFRRIGE